MQPLLKKTVLLSLFLLIQSTTCIFGTAAVLETRYSGVIQQGIAVNGIPVGGLTPAEAARKLENALPSPAKTELKFEDTEKSHTIALSDIDGKYDYLATAEEALKCGKKGVNLSHLMSVLRLRAEPAELAPKIIYDEEKLRQVVKLLEEKWEVQPQDATVKILNNEVIIIPEKNGYSLDFEKTLEQARLALARGTFHIAASGRVLKPEITCTDLKGIDTLLSEYTTTFNSSAGNRTHNIALASAAIDGVLLKPGEVFSLNRQLGPRLAQAGYLKAPVIMKNRLVEDFGGGICQVATTLYNAVLLAGLEVIERFPHSRPVNYAPPGLDATISGDYLDLKFANNTGATVYIASQLGAETYTVRIFGRNKDNNQTIRIKSENIPIKPKVVVIQDDTVPKGETKVINPGKAGYKVKVYREVVVDGRVESRTLISEDFYSPEDRVIYTGPREEELEK